MAKTLFPTALTYARKNKNPLEAYKVFTSLAELQAYVDNADQTAYEGQTASVTGDTNEKNNGYYFVKTIGTQIDGVGDPGVVEKVGGGDGSGAITATNYTAACELATSDNLGQIIFAMNREPIIDPETGEQKIDPETGEPMWYAAGPYIVTGAGAVSKLGTTSASGDIQGDVETLKGEVGTLIEEVSAITEDIENIESEVSALTETVSGLAADVETLMGDVDIEGSVDNKIASALTEYATSADTEEAIATAKDEAVAAASAYTDEQVAAAISASDVTITVASQATSGYLKTYVFTQGEEEIGKIDIPKDLVVTSGEIIIVDDEHPVAGLEPGKYLKLTIANQDEPVYINVADLCDVYTGDNETIVISDTNVISVKEGAFSGAAEEVKEELIGDKSGTTTTGYTIADIKRALEAAKEALGQDILDEAAARASGDTALLGDTGATATTTTGNTIADVKRALEAAKAALNATGIGSVIVTSATTGTTIGLSDEAESVLSNALVGIVEGAESGVEIDENKLDFSKISINCGTF